jgi:hypothetical protein
MIIGQNFIWLHFPKCAGTFTENLLKANFSNDSTVMFDKLDPQNVIWHQNVGQREKKINQDLSGKNVICNFRRLPSWILSRANYESSRSGFTAPRELILKGQFFDNLGKISTADFVLAKYTEREVQHWIRVEYLNTDFYSAFSHYLDVGIICSLEVFTNKINKSIPTGDQHFNQEEIRGLYQSNPLWTSLESRLYGNLLVEY